MVVIIDNYDSFTYNLVQLIRELQAEEPLIMRNDKIQDATLQKADHIVLSPGPGIPNEAGQMPEVISKYAGKIPMLGVCLGHQAIGEHYGAMLRNLTQVYHGRKTRIFVHKEPLLPYSMTCQIPLR
jgi:anthranilate synthase component 2